MVELAREAVRRAVLGEPPPEPGDDPALDALHGAFVTLHKEGKLRGCIGHPLPVESLGPTMLACSRASALEDSRFLPVTPEELDGLQVEVSVLTPPRRISDPSEVEVGRHGLIIGQGGQRGLLLPQVPTSLGWDRQTFLSHTCLKAGLDRNAWKKGATIEVFEAQVFGDPLDD